MMTLGRPARVARRGWPAMIPGLLGRHPSSTMIVSMGAPLRV